MSEPGQWQVAGSAPEVYERELVPAVFGPWAPIVVELAHPSLGERVVDLASAMRQSAGTTTPDDLPTLMNVRYWPIADIPVCTAHVRFRG